MTATPELSLAADFPAATREQWLALVDKVLKGADFDRKLVSQTYDGIAIQPLYTRDAATASGDGGLPGQGSFTRGATVPSATGGSWGIGQRQANPERSAANAEILEDLEGGADSLILQLDLGANPSGGIAVGSLDDLDSVLGGVYLELITIVLDAGADAAEAADLLVALWDRRNVAAADRRAHLALDPLGTLARTGVLPNGLDAALADLARLATAAGAWPQVRVAEVDTSPYVDAGATEVEELAVMVATGVAYLRALTGAGLALDAAARELSFTVTADTDVFATIAKIRAARRLWAHALAAAGVTGEAGEAAAPPLSALTSTRIMSQRDPWTNMLRTTAACFAAGAAGATSVTVQPFDAALGLPDGLARRVARNTQLILLEESHIGSVLDPAGGSYYVETLTDQFTERAWTRFQEIEAAGGMAAVLADGSEAAAIAAQYERRLANIATRRDPITGVSEFPDIAETLLERATPAGSGAPEPSAGASATTVSPLPSIRLAEPFEALRDASDAAAARTGSRPSVFLANLGPVATHTARATFAKNFFEAGGVEAVGADGYESPEDLAAAFTASGSKLAVICSSDAVYAERAEAAAVALRAAGCTRLYLAGNPGELRATLENAGVDEFISVGANVLAVLTTAHEALGVIR